MNNETLTQSDSLITKIGSKESQNNKILALVIAVCLSIIIYQYDFMGLSFLKDTERTVVV